MSVDIAILINQLIKLFAILCLGYLTFKFNIIDTNFNQKCSKMLVNVTMPLMIISSVLKLTERPSFGTVLTVFVVAILMYTVLPALGYVISLITRTPKEHVGVYTFMYTFSNVGFMGFPILSALYGNTAVFYAGIVNIIFNLACYSYGIVLINKGTEVKSEMNLKLLCSSGMICSVLSIILFAFNIKFPEVATDTIATIGDITPPLSMLLIGSTLATIDLKDIFNETRVYFFVIIKQIILPLALIPLCMLFIKDELVLGVTFIMLLVPVANSAVLFTTNYGHDEKLAAKAVFLSTLLSMFTIPTIIMIFS